MAKHRLLILGMALLAALATFSVTMASAGQGAVIDGVWRENAPPRPAVPPAPYVAPMTGTQVINFDDVTAPCIFASTTALRGQYATLGVHFSGPAALDGGGILNECGNFGVTGYSPPNFLAFNVDSQFSDGGIPRPPETIAFDAPLGYFEAKLGSGDSAGQVATIEAFGVGGTLLYSTTLTLGPTLAPASITGSGIYTVVISFPGSIFVLDDMAFHGEPTSVAVTAVQASSPATGTFGWLAVPAVALALALGLGLRRRRR